jgi:hypothetical protein
VNASDLGALPELIGVIVAAIMAVVRFGLMALARDRAS